MTRVLRSGVDPLAVTDDDDLDRCVCCELPIPPLTGVAYGGGIAHPNCIAPCCAICDQPEGDTEWGRFVPLGDGVAHAGCELDRNSSMADTYLLRVLP